MSEQEKTGTERTPAERQVQLYRDTVLELQARVRELEAIETAYKLTLEQCAHEQEENARLRKVVDAAIEASEELKVGVKGFDEISKLLDDAVACVAYGNTE